MNKEILEILKGIKKDLDIIVSDKEAKKKPVKLHINDSFTKNSSVKVYIHDSEKGSVKHIEPKHLITYLCAHIDNLVTEIDIKKKLD